MKIATFNANSIRSRLGIVCDWLVVHQPDVLAVQETKAQDKDFPALAFTELGYHATFRGQKSYNGVALLTRERPTQVAFGLDDDPEHADEARLVRARVGSLHVVNTYVPQGREIEHEMYAYKLAWFARLKQYFDKHFTTRQRVVWLGDLNVAPLPMDIHNAAQQEQHVCYHIDCREAFADACAWGFEDVFRKHHPEPEQYTFFDYRSRDALKKKQGWRIDHILATRSLARRSTDAYIDLEPRKAERPSDHTFLVAEFAE